MKFSRNFYAKAQKYLIPAICVTYVSYVLVDRFKFNNKKREELIDRKRQRIAQDIEDAESSDE
jgi:hypothetical protein